MEMTIAERQQIEDTAQKIRSRWLAGRDAERLKAAAPAPTSTASPCKTITAEDYVANVTAKRPLGPQDLGMLTALEADLHAAPWLKARDVRRRRKQLIHAMKFPDLSGLMDDIDEDALRENPDLAERYERMIQPPRR